jgi:hypothetical protein
MDAAIEYAELHRHRLMERVAQQPGWSEATIAKENRTLLVKGGFLKQV